MGRCQRATFGDGLSLSASVRYESNLNNVVASSTSMSVFSTRLSHVQLRACYVNYLRCRTTIDQEMPSRYS